MNKLNVTLDGELDEHSGIDLSHDEINNNHESEVYSETENMFKKKENTHPLIKLPFLNKEALSQEELNKIQLFQEQHIQSQQKLIEFLYNYISYQKTRIECLENTPKPPLNESDPITKDVPKSDVILYFM